MVPMRRGERFAQTCGRTMAHVLSDTDPGDGFTAHQGGLGDVYFATLHATRRAA